MAAFRGEDSPEPSTRELVGFMLLADAIHCLQHIREANTERKKG